MKNDVHIGKLISIFYKRIHRRIGLEVRQYGLTSIQGRILGFVYSKSAIRDIFQKDIEEEFDIRRSSVTSVLQLMEKKGYIKRISVSEDARLKKIILTKNGIDIQNKIYDRIIEFEKSLEDGLNNEEKEILVSLINRLSDKIAD
ncbi:regulatory protein MarR [Ruminiclostridium papyrosolvens DSM 2782]|uniref:Regulatory protein MarR n=1 Tax=Ruminiclostridium papyrosolvens DSM 2782 TaxID=588581 RepID=F1T9F1_9FIRM|nr:MarR family transcriptional regulator [Ruminiclostridium papyrosolvens]EGD49133.1 regulatory protein MarR [Ruminiclostridium papyrosolvens DSM 2782]WES35611.1 MarR family transcriptional regulator [Ruminiclostridium papyrosolvens DSM 2782]